MKVIFLDVDGVLNEVSTETRSPSGFQGVDDNKIEQLARIVKKTGAVIVLSSTWRYEFMQDEPNSVSPDGEYLVNKLKEHGLEIFGMTDNLGGHIRGKEIYKWLTNSPEPVSHYVILDDNFFRDFDYYLITKYWVRTNYLSGGLTKEAANRAIAILSGREE